MITQRGVEGNIFVMLVQVNITPDLTKSRSGGFNTFTERYMPIRTVQKKECKKEQDQEKENIPQPPNGKKVGQPKFSQHSCAIHKIP